MFSGFTEIFSNSFGSGTLGTNTQPAHPQYQQRRTRPPPISTPSYHSQYNAYDPHTASSASASAPGTGDYLLQPSPPFPRSPPTTYDQHIAPQQQPLLSPNDPAYDFDPVSGVYKVRNGRVPGVAGDGGRGGVESMRKEGFGGGGGGGLGEMYELGDSRASEAEYGHGYRPSHADPTRRSMGISGPEDQLAAEDYQLKRWIRAVRFGMRCLVLVCSTVVVALFAHNLVVYNRTKHIVGMWPEKSGRGALIWSSVLLLVVACISTATSIVILASYCWSVKIANRLALGHTAFDLVFGIVSVFIWGLTGGLFKQTDSNPRSLWQWACHPAKAGRDMTLSVTGDVNWKQYCKEQDWNWVCALINIAFEAIMIAIAIGVYYLVWRRTKVKNRIVARGGRVPSPA
ncbi:hypothetical protein YB2330_001303 [Saitoella coloradoensis]